MRKVLFLLTAIIFSAPQAAFAESIWLIVRYSTSKSRAAQTALEKIQVKDMNQCEEMGAKWISSQRIGTSDSNLVFECLQGK